MIKKTYLKRTVATCLMLAALLVLGLVFRPSASTEVPESCEVCGEAYVNGFCSCEGEDSYQPIAVNEDGAYEIANAGQLYSLAKLINNTLDLTRRVTVDAVITADITVNEKVIENGEVVSDVSALRNWTPINNYDAVGDNWTSLELNIDGRGHVISGLYVSSETYSSSGTALIGYLYFGRITHLGIVDSYVSSDGGFYTSSFAGVAENVTVRDCFSTALINGSSLYTGGIVGEGGPGTLIENCYFTGRLLTKGKLDGNAIVCDRYDRETVINCYAADNVGAGAGRGISVSAEKITSGYLTYKLNSGVTDGTQVWYQTVGEGAPAYSGATVYASSPCISEFSNSPDGVALKEHSFTLPASYDNTHHWDSECELCAERLNPTEHDAADECSCGFIPDFKVERVDGGTDYYTEVESISLQDGDEIVFLKSIKSERDISIYSIGTAYIDLNGFKIEMDIGIHCDAVITDRSYYEGGEFNAYLSAYLYSASRVELVDLTIGEDAGIYVSGDNALLTIEKAVIKNPQFFYSYDFDDKIRLIDAELTNGISLTGHSLDELLFDNSYYADADGNKIVLTEGQSKIEGKAYYRTPLLSVTVGDETVEYPDYETALKSIGDGVEAHIKLLRDINVYKFLEHNFIISQGDITLDLAGYEINNSLIKVYTGASLRIVDSSEDQSGAINQPSGVVGITLNEGALLTIDGGNINSDIVTSSPIVITGGVIDAGIDSESAEGSVTVTDGHFTSLRIYPNYEGGEILSGATISGGTFEDLDLRNGLTLGDILAEGYLARSEDGSFITDGTLISVNKRFSVVYHEHDFKLSFNSEAHFTACDCGVEGASEEHYGGIATCDSGKLCSVCEYEYTEALGHAWDSGVVTVEPDCETPGELTYTCQNDPSHVSTEPISPIGHAWDGGVVTVEPDCETPGELTYTCQNEPSHVSTESISPIGHSYDGGKCEVCGKLAAIGYSLDGTEYLYTDNFEELKAIIQSGDYGRVDVKLSDDLILPTSEGKSIIASYVELTIDFAGHCIENLTLQGINSTITLVDSSGEAKNSKMNILLTSGELRIEGGSVNGLIYSIPIAGNGFASVHLSGGSHTLFVLGVRMDIVITGGEYTDLAIEYMEKSAEDKNRVSIIGGSFTNINVTRQGGDATLSEILSDKECVSYTVADGSSPIDTSLGEYVGSFTAHHDDTHATGEYESDAISHWRVCENGVRVGIQSHTYTEDVVCDECGSTAAFIVTVGGIDHGFASIDKALKVAMNSHGARLTLNSDAMYINYAEIENLLVLGDLTIDLNGHTLSIVAYIEISSGSLKLVDDSEDGGGRLEFYSIEVYDGELALGKVEMSSVEDMNSYIQLTIFGSDLTVDGAIFSSKLVLEYDSADIFFIDATFDYGLNVIGEYDLLHLLSIECLMLTDEQGEAVILSSDIYEYEEILVVKHAGTYPLTEWYWYDIGVHARDCAYCGYTVEIGACSGGEADCELGEVCEVCGCEYGMPLGHVVSGRSCEICGASAPITVVSADNTRHFFLATEAFAWADGFESAIVILNQSYDHYEGADIDIKSAKVTLELNGHTLDVREINIYGGSLTVMDSSGRDSGIFYADDLDVYNGALIIDSGYFYYLSVELDPDGMEYSAGIVIRGGYFHDLYIDTDGGGEHFIEIFGGSFYSVELKIDDPASISVSGGEFYRIHVGQGSYYCYLDEIFNVRDCVKLIDEDGRRIFFESESVEFNEYVRFVHDPKADAEAVLNYGSVHHWYECECGVVSNRERHSGGVATCDTLAVCDICDASYGDYAPHSFDDTLTCTECDFVAEGIVKVEVGEHTAYVDDLYDAFEFIKRRDAYARITLLDNLVMAEALEAYSVDFLLDLNGYTLDLEQMFIGDADITIIDGSAEKTGVVAQMVIEFYEGSLVIEGGSYYGLYVVLNTMYSGSQLAIFDGNISELIVGAYTELYSEYMTKPTTASFEIRGGAIEALTIITSDYLDARMLGGVITESILLESEGDKVIGDLIPYSCYHVLGEDGLAIENIAALTEYVGYLEVAHKDSFTVKFDGDVHYNECVCGIRSEAQPHEYDNNCDGVCDDCGNTREPAEHIYDNACDKTCNVCDEARVPAEHVYDNACDGSCNVCGEGAPKEHIYDNACDETCNVCGGIRATDAHDFGELVVEQAAGANNAGKGTRTCASCGATEEVEIPASGGISTGGVIAISAGGTLLATGGGFSLFWFVIKKKTFAELLGIFS